GAAESEGGLSAIVECSGAAIAATEVRARGGVRWESRSGRAGTAESERGAASGSRICRPAAVREIPAALDDHDVGSNSDHLSLLAGQVRSPLCTGVSAHHSLYIRESARSVER